MSARAGFLFLKPFPRAFPSAASSSLGQEAGVAERWPRLEQSRCGDDEGNRRATAAGEEGESSAEDQGAFGFIFKVLD